jgi:hypothetical protein
LERLPQIAMVHQVPERFFDRSKNAHPHALHDFNRLQVPR